MRIIVLTAEVVGTILEVLPAPLLILSNKVLALRIQNWHVK